MSGGSVDQLLFTYGTLQFAEVQLDTFGHIVAGEGDTLPGYTTDYTEITDHRIVDVSGLSVHPMIRHTGNAVDKVLGKVLHVTFAEIEAADEYEVPLYHRERVTLGSGRSAWVYVG
ncbi:gamma-glutamylcyclotransferase family protein [Microbacterium sp.]|uniref:gamma-glutamylcyclotransferase family protein n=1 Tax=Microbacterium sp. TaxID=51671 RepID=UPI0025EA119D|nr:gamma-glutamylcyclotransferase family protein [Microbacterium sp.]